MEEEKKERVYVNLKEELASIYQHIFTIKPKRPNIILQSGRSCTKSTFLCIWDLYRIMSIPHADIMVLGYEMGAMADSIFSDYVKAADILHLPDNIIEFHKSTNVRMWI